MPFNEKTADRVREALLAAGVKKLEEKRMFGGLCFMVHDKMCIGINADDIMCRIDPDMYEQALEREGAREMDFTGRPIRGYVFVHVDSIKKKADLDYWVSLCLAFNKKAKASKKK